MTQNTLTKMRFWTPDEDQTLRDIIAADYSPFRRTAEYRKRLPNRSRSAIQRHAKDIGLARINAVYHPWTDAERDHLRSLWPTLPRSVIAEQLGRSVSSVGNEARRLGLFPRQHWARIEITPELDRAIVLAYNSPRHGNCKRVADQFGVEIGWVKSRARQLHLTRGLGYKTPWSPEEDAMLEELHERGGVRFIHNRMVAAGYPRSMHAILLRASALCLSWKNRDTYNANELGKIMGVDGKTIINWINKGVLKAHRENVSGISNREEPYHWMIHHRDVRKFLIEEVGRYSLATVDRYWYVSTLAGRLGPERIQHTCGHGDELECYKVAA